jgi:transglutaminase-like putative cysteine protease
MWIETKCRLELDYEQATPIILMLRSRSGAGQWIAREAWHFSQQVDVQEYTDPFGNLCQKLVIPPDGFVIETSAVVKTATEMDSRPGARFVDVLSLPEEVYHYLLPSRYCESDRLGSKALEIAGEAAPGYDQVARIGNWIRSELPYVPGSSAVPNTAMEILAEGRGVCRDLAHLGVALCRSISIPARFVAGYLHGLEPMDLHAWFEAYVGGRWYTFDPTQSGLEGARVTIAYGRDAADVAIYHQFGPPARFTDMQVTVSEVAPPVNRA